MNQHKDGNRGTYEGKVPTADGQNTIEGMFAFTGGSGKFKGIAGGGKYKGRFTWPVDVVCDWEGQYQLAQAKAQAR